MYWLPDWLSIYLSVCLHADFQGHGPAQDAVEKRLRMSQLWVNFCLKLQRFFLLHHLANI